MGASGRRFPDGCGSDRSDGRMGRMGHMGQSRIERDVPMLGLSVRARIVAALGFVVAAVAMPAGAWVGFGLLQAGALAAASVSGLGTVYAIRRAFVALPFVLAAAALPFTVPGQALFHLGGLTASVEGTVRFVSIMMRTFLSAQMAILLTAATTRPKLLRGLRSLRMPAALVAIAGFMLRYVDVLAD